MPLSPLSRQNAQLNGGARVIAVALTSRRRHSLRRAVPRARIGYAHPHEPQPFNDPARQRALPDRHRRLAHACSGETLRTCIKPRRGYCAPRTLS